MKKIVAGLGFLFSGIFLYISASIIGSINLQYTTSWQTSIGRYWQSVIDCGMMPVMIIGFILMASGIIFMVWGVFERPGGTKQVYIAPPDTLA